jgi:hypothetical protein
MPGFDEEINRIRVLIKTNNIIGNRKEIKRLLIEDFRALLFNQDQYLRKVYRAIEELHQKCHDEPVSELFQGYLSKLEIELNRGCEVLNSWTDDPIENLQIFRRVYSVNTQKNIQEENK